MRYDPYIAFASNHKCQYVLAIMDIWPFMLHHARTLLWHVSLMHNPHKYPRRLPVLGNHKQEMK